MGGTAFLRVLPRSTASGCELSWHKADVAMSSSMRISNPKCIYSLCEGQEEKMDLAVG